MEKILDVAQYIFEKYKKETGKIIDEMKLQKLLYFAQRESFAITGERLFDGDFEGWRLGPVSREVRNVYTQEGIYANTSDISEKCAYIVNNVILEYGQYASWKLSELSHNEISWTNARKGLKESQYGDKKLLLEDIKKDAEKVRPYDHVWDMYYDEFEDVDIDERGE